MAAKKKSGGRKYGKGASKKVAGAMRKRKKGNLKSGSGRKVTSKKQAIAIGLSEARRSGKKVPKKKSAKKGGAKKTSAKKGGAKKKAAKKTKGKKRR